MSSIDDALAVPLERPAAKGLVATVCFGIACAVGLAGAFIGLDTHGFWFDELFTARLLQPDGTSLLSRIVTDVHPPIYLAVLSIYSRIVGDSDVALRSLSSLCACGAIVVFVTATKRTFSLAGRLFGAALATGSVFWFFQAQNARSYALGLVISAGILALALRLLAGQLQQRDRRLALGGLVVLMFVGSFVHFYIMYECLAVLIVLAFMMPAERHWAAAVAVALLIASALYVKLVVEPSSQASLGSNWYPNDPVWYGRVLLSCVRNTFGGAGLAAIALCAAAILLGRMSGPAQHRRAPRPMAALLSGVPVLVLAGAVVSSTVLAPNFYDRNFLILSPFFWAASAALYDAAAAAAPKLVRQALDVALGVIVLSMASIVMLRLPSSRSLDLDYEPFRESAEWIKTLPACHNQVVPVISTDLAAWYKPGYAETIYISGYGRYLQGFAQPQLIFFQDIRTHTLPQGLKTELQRRIDGEGCPVLAWAAHNMPAGAMAVARDELLKWADRATARTKVTTKAFQDDSPGFVLYAAQLAQPGY